MTAPPGEAPAILVTDVRRSIEFYAYLGFEVKGELETEGVATWAWLATEGAELMLNRAGAPFEVTQVSKSGAVLTLYARDLGRLNDQLLGAGVKASWQEGGQEEGQEERQETVLRLRDPDGYLLLVSERE